MCAVRRKMRKMRKMRVNSVHLASLSRGGADSFTREGRLRVGREGGRQGVSERWCRLRGNLLFIMKKPDQNSDLDEVVVLERCHILEARENSKGLIIRFESGEAGVCVETASASERGAWGAALRDANTETLTTRIRHLRTLLTQTPPEHPVCMQPPAKLVPLDLSLECRGLVATVAKDKEPCVMVQVAVIDTHTHLLTDYCCTEVAEGTRDPVFLMGVCFPPGYPLCWDTRLKLTVYLTRDKTLDTRSFLGFTSFSIRDVFSTKEPQLSLSLRSVDGVSGVGEVRVGRLGEMEEGERDATTPPDILGHRCPLLCDSLHGSMDDKDNSPMMRAVFRSPVCKVYRFQNEAGGWLLVREQMSDTRLSFSLPRQLLALHIQDDMRRVQELRDLGDLSPHWDALRSDVIGHHSQLISCYQDTLTQLHRLTGSESCFKPSSSKSNRHLEFIPVNLHTQRIQVTCPRKTGVWYDIVTVGAPADHHQGFKHGGLQRLNKLHTDKKSVPGVSYSPEESSRAREVLSSVAQLQPLISGLAEGLLQASLELSSTSLQEALQGLAQRTEQFVHALKDELVKSTLLALHAAPPVYLSPAPVTAGNGTAHCPSANQKAPLPLRRQDAPQCTEFDEEEWDRVWANVAMSLNCIIAMVDRLQGRENSSHEVNSEQRKSSTNPDSDVCSWQEQLLPLVVTLRECVSEAGERARSAMAYVLLQGAMSTASPGPLLRHRRDAVFSQALSALVCGFVLRLFSGLEDPAFLLQLQEVGVIAQYEGLLSTYGDEVGMLEDMEVGVSDLDRVSFTISQAASDLPSDLQPSLSCQRDGFIVEVPLPPETFLLLPGSLRDGRALRVHPLLFNIGINQHQSLAERFGDSSLQERINHRSCELLKTYYRTLTHTLPSLALPVFQSQADVEELLRSLEVSLENRKRKNVQVLWLAAAICRRLNGIRLTSCKSAKDRTAMSVTLEQCVLLRDEHTLSKHQFTRALDCMRSAKLAPGQTDGPVPCSCQPERGCMGEPEGECVGELCCCAPERGCVWQPRPLGRHLYPLAVLLVTSHLLVVWLLLSLLVLLAKHQ